MTTSVEPAVRTPPSRPRPSPTTQLFTMGENFVVYAGGEDFLTVELGATAAAELVDVLTGGTDLARCTALDEATATDVTAELVAEGLLTATAEASPRVPRAMVLGTGPVADAVRALLPGAASRPVSETPAPGSVDLVIACAGWLPDANWRSLDAELAGRGMAWHRCWGDGTALHIGPLSLPGAGPGYEDVRRRQLAATDSPELLLALWSHWDQTAPPHPAPDPGSAAVAAGMMVADAFDLVAGRVPTGSTEQRELDLTTHRILSHPVLPVPGSAWLSTP